MRQRTLVVALILLAAGLGLSAALPDPAPRTTSKSVLIRDIPHVLQKPDFCGEACVAAWLAKLGLPIDQDAVFDRSGLDPHLGRGCYTKELVAAMKNLGFATGKVWYSFKAKEAPKQLDALWQQVRADLDAGQPSVVCTRFDDKPNTTEHFRLVVWCDARTEEVLYDDPAVNKGA